MNIMCAVRGPILMITLGVLLAIDQNGGPSFGRTWPVLLIIFGLFKLAERAGTGMGPGPHISSGTSGSGTSGSGPGTSRI